MSPQLEPIDFEKIVENLPEKWEESVRYPVEKVSDDLYRVNDDDGSSNSVRIVKRENNWYTWCGCSDFDGLEFCVHVFSVARTLDEIEVDSTEEVISEKTGEEDEEENLEGDEEVDGTGGIEGSDQIS